VDFVISYAIFLKIDETLANPLWAALLLQVEQSGKEMLGSMKFRRFHGSSIPGRNILAVSGVFWSNSCSFQCEMVGIQRKNPKYSGPGYCFRFHGFSGFSCRKWCFFLVFPAGSDRFWKAE
jgi:hypothetical protein